MKALSGAALNRLCIKKLDPNELTFGMSKVQVRSGQSRARLGSQIVAAPEIGIWGATQSIFCHT